MSSKSDAGVDAGGKSSGSSRESSIRVQVGTGNERNGSISQFPLEVRQCVHDIVSWYERATEKTGDVRDLDLTFRAVEDAAVMRLQEAYVDATLPDSLQMMFTKYALFYLYEFRLMPVDRMLDVGREKGYTRKNLLPIAADIDETLLVLDLSSGCVLSICVSCLSNPV